MEATNIMVITTERSNEYSVLESKIFRSFDIIPKNYFNDNGYINRLYVLKLKYLKRYRKHLFDENQTEKIIQKLNNEIYNNYNIRIYLLRLERLFEFNKSFYHYKNDPNFSIARKKKRNLTVFKINKFLTKHLKQKYMEGLSILLLPHDIENLIMSFVM